MCGVGHPYRGQNKGRDKNVKGNEQKKKKSMQLWVLHTRFLLNIIKLVAKWCIIPHEHTHISSQTYHIMLCTAQTQILNVWNSSLENHIAWRNGMSCATELTVISIRMLGTYLCHDRPHIRMLFYYEYICHHLIGWNHSQIGGMHIYNLSLLSYPHSSISMCSQHQHCG